MIKNKTGVWGEIYAARYLRDNGYEVIERNFVSRFGELDLVSAKDGIYCVTEVKTRNIKSEISPKEAVDKGKRERLETATKSFFAYAKITGRIRFDVCEVFVDDKNNLVRINYIENAF